MKKLVLSILALTSSLCAAQQTIAPFKTPYGNFTQGIQFNGDFGTLGQCWVASGGGSQWGTCPGGLAGVSPDGLSPAGIIVAGNVRSATVNSARINSLLITPSLLPAPVASVASIGGSGGASLTGACQYQVRFMTASSGATDASVASNIVTPAAQMVSITLPNDPTGLAGNWEVYRNNCSNSSGSLVKGLMFWAAEVPYVGGGTTWTDTVTDANLTYTPNPYTQFAMYFNQTATTAQFMPPSVGTPVITWNETNLRPIVGPDILEAYPNSALPRLGNYNLAQFTENFTVGSHGWGNTGQDTANTISVSGVAAQPITLTHWNFNNAAFGPTQGIAGSGYTFTPAQAYLFSFFVKAQAPIEQDISLSSSAVLGGVNMWMHGWVDQLTRRKWFYCVAVTGTTLDCGSQTPTTAYGSGTPSSSITWFAGGNLNRSFVIPPGLTFATGDLYAGGMQITPVATTNYGIVAYGDSLTQGDCGVNDVAGCSSWVGIASGLMNVPIFNRGTGGITCNSLGAGYAATVHPILLANRAAYVIIKCGTNDLSAGFSAATIEGYLTTLIGDVVTDGKIPVIETIQPQDKARSFPTSQYEAPREQVNAWIRGNCGKLTGATGPAGGCPYVLDMDKIVQDPLQGNVIRNDPSWMNQTDGTHPQFNEGRAEGEYVAQSFVGNTTGHPQIWNFPIPPQYQAVAATVPTSDVAGGHVLTAGAGGVADGGTPAVCTGSCVGTNQNTPQALQTGPTANTSGYVVLSGLFNGGAGTAATFFFENSSAGNWTVSGITFDNAKHFEYFICPGVTSIAVPASGCTILYTFTGNGANSNLTFTNGTGSAVTAAFPAVSANYTVQADLESFNAGCTGATTFAAGFSMNTCTVTGAITLTINNGNYAGQLMTVTFCENATGGFAVSTPASVTNWTPISTTALACTIQVLTWSAGLTKWLSR